MSRKGNGGDGDTKVRWSTKPPCGRSKGGGFVQSFGALRYDKASVVTLLISKNPMLLWTANAMPVCPWETGHA